MEIASERPRHGFSSRQGPRRDELLGIALESPVIASSYHREAQELHIAKKFCSAVLDDHLAEDLPKHSDVAPELSRNFLTGTIPPSLWGDGLPSFGAPAQASRGGPEGRGALGQVLP